MTDSLIAELGAGLEKHYPDSDLTRAAAPIVHDIHLRYELGGEFENGSDERLEQATTRAAAILQGCFGPDERLLLLINDWDSSDPMFGNTTPDHLYELLGPALMAKAEQRDILPPDEAGEESEAPFRQTVLPVTLAGTPWRELLAGIANYEQGREPSIGQAVYFIAPATGIAFHMYDDRGCLVFAQEVSRIAHLYREFNAWLVDYWRATIDELFASDG
jgi:hypothetical protein